MENDADFNEDLINNQKEFRIFEITKRFIVLRKCASHYPRTYFFITELILPLMILLGIAYGFGSALARLEAPGEISENDVLLSGVFSSYTSYIENMITIHETVRVAPSSCLMDYDKNVTVQELVATKERQNILNELKQCAITEARNQFPITPLFPDYFIQASPTLTFNWISCDRMPSPSDEENPSIYDYDLQYRRFVTDFTTSFLEAMPISIDSFEDFLSLDNDIAVIHE
jgi:hypothetical protein